jgi:hypothetical protein
MPAMTVYGGSTGVPLGPRPPRDRLLVVATAVGAVGVLVGIVLATGILSGGGGRSATQSAVPTPAAATPAPARPAAPAAPTTTPADGVRGFKSVATGRCLEPTAEEDPEGAKIRLGDCGGAPAQRWHVLAAPESSVTVVNVASGKCLDVEGLNKDDGGAIQQYSCNGGPNQRWRLSFDESDPARAVALVGVDSGKCVDIPGGDPNARMQQFTCTGAANQRWTDG